MKSLHDLPRFRDRWSYLYLERGMLDKETHGLALHTVAGDSLVPIDQLSLLMLGPGISVTHAAIKALADNNCLVAWVGEQGIRMYAHSSGGTFSARRLVQQARLCSDEALRLGVVYRMYQKRFPGILLEGKTLEQVRGMEGQRVRQSYKEIAARHQIAWEGRNYDQDDWFEANAANRALSAGHACLYGVCHAAIVSAGYSAGLGFIHTGRMLSFVYDIADLYKTETTVPLAFALAATVTKDLERTVRQECRKVFHEYRLMDKILPDIAEVLNVSDDPGESAEEMEGRAVALADGGAPGDVPGQPEPESPG
jgi:CRISP-associated protein Cas1